MNDGMLQASRAERIETLVRQYREFLEASPVEALPAMAIFTVAEGAIRQPIDWRMAVGVAAMSITEEVQRELVPRMERALRTMAKVVR